MKIEYTLTERIVQEKGVFLTYRKFEIPDTWLDRLLGRKSKATLVKVFYPIDGKIHHKTDLAYVPGGEPVLLYEWGIFINLLNIRDAENEPVVKVEKIYSKEPLRCKEGWVPNKENEFKW